MPTALIAPSILSANFSILGEEIKAVEAAGADWIHVDVMDGHFVPNLTFGPIVVEHLRLISKLPLDCHLMVSNPEAWIQPFAQAGADWITVHAESTPHLDRVLNQIREAKCQVGVSLNPATPLAMIEEVLDLVDLVLLMGVNPGFGGQKFIESTFGKVERLVKLRAGRSFLVSIDGGVSTQNIGQLQKMGANIFVVGSAIFSTQDRRKAMEKLRCSLNESE